MSLEIRPIRPEEMRDYIVAIRRTFGWQLPSDQEVERAGQVPDYCSRSLAAFDGAAIRATAGAFTFAMTVPGGELPTAGVTRVTVASTHRRRGLLTALMRRQLDDVHDRAEPLAVLYASEAPIYGRFGYGVASFHGQITVQHAAAFRPAGWQSPGEVRFVEAEQALKVFPALWADLKPRQPGMVSREESWWQSWLEDSPEQRAPGLTAHYRVLYEEAGRPRGFGVYRIRQEWRGGRPAGTLHLERLISVTPAAYAGLWRFLLDVDLMESVRAEGRPPEEALRFLLQDLRLLEATVHDGLWLRLVDVPAALVGRAYARQGRLRLELSDDFCTWNQGRYELEAGAGGASCRRTRAATDLALPASALASAYLGGVGFRALARAGLVKELSPGALERADAMFASDPPPWCPVHF